MFLHTEKTNIIKESGKEEVNAKFTLLGIPFDSTETNLAGQRKAPNSIRNALLEIETGNLFDKIADIGNLIPVEGNASKTLLRLEQTLDDLFSRSPKTIPVLLGGEHTITLGAARAIIKQHEEFDILCFDAHYDLKDNWQGEKINHSTVMRRIWDINRNITFIGTREHSKEELDFFKKNSIDKNNGKIMDSKRPLYITVDVDAFDPSIIPGVSDSVPSGLSIKEFFDALGQFKKRKIIGIDIAEFNPLIEGHITSRNIAYILRELLGLV